MFIEIHRQYTCIKCHTAMVDHVTYVTSKTMDDKTQNFTSKCCKASRQERVYKIQVGIKEQ